MTEKSQAILNAKAHSMQQGANLITGIVYLARLHLVFCAVAFIWTAADGKVSETWKLGLPVTLLGAPALVNAKKLEEKGLQSIES